MGSAISRIVIKSDQISRKIPAPGQVVGVVGESGLFIVMNVDQKDRMVQLMERGGRHRLKDVPFSSVRVFKQSLLDAIRRFLDDSEAPPENR